MRKILLLFALSALWSSKAGAQGLALDPFYMVQNVQRREVDTWLKEEIKASHGDFSKDRYLFVFAFNTIQADRNKLQMTAMKRLAFSLLNNSLAPGDQALPAAWEVDLWDIGESPISLDTGVQGRAQFARGIQTTHSGKWTKNHDINRSFVSLARRLHDRGASLDSTIILMFTDSGSISGNSEEIWGMLHPDYVAALQKYGFRERVDNSFPCASRDGKVQLNVGIAGFFPKQLKSLPGDAGNRFPTYDRATWQPKEDAPPSGEVLPNPTVETPSRSGEETAKTPHPNPREEPPPRSSQFPWIPVIVGLIAVLLIVATVVYVSKQRVNAPASPIPAPTPTASLVLTAVLGQNAPAKTFTVPVGRKARWQIARPAESDTLVVIDLSETENAPEAAPEKQVTPLVDLTLDAEGTLLLAAAPGCKIERPSGSFEPLGVDTSRYKLPSDRDGYFYLKADSLNDSKRIELKLYQEDAHAYTA